VKLKKGIARGGQQRVCLPWKPSRKDVVAIPYSYRLKP
jgi:hypothetical protein